MRSKILTNKGKVIHHSSVWPIDDIDDDRYKECFADLNFSLKESIGAHLMNGLPPEDNDGDKFSINTPTYEPYEDDQTPKQDTPEVEDYQGDSFDKLISARVSLPVAGTQQQRKVLRQK